MNASPLRRAFCAVVWDQTAAAPLRALQESLRALDPDTALRWLDPADLHCTLRYYGDVDASQHAALAHALAAHASRGRRSTFEFECLECWPVAHPQVLVARLHAAPALLALQSALEREAQALGLERETRAFRAHATLARIGTGWNGPRLRAKLASFTLPVNDIALWYRRPDDAGPRYAEAARQPCRTS